MQSFWIYCFYFYEVALYSLQASLCAKFLSLSVREGKAPFNKLWLFLIRGPHKNWGWQSPILVFFGGKRWMFDWRLNLAMRESLYNVSNMFLVIHHSSNSLLQSIINTLRINHSHKWILCFLFVFFATALELPVFVPNYTFMKKPWLVVSTFDQFYFMSISPYI